MVRLETRRDADSTPGSRTRCSLVVHPAPGIPTRGCSGTLWQFAVVLRNLPSSSRHRLVMTTAAAGMPATAFRIPQMRQLCGVAPAPVTGRVQRLRDPPRPRRCDEEFGRCRYWLRSRCGDHERLRRAASVALRCRLRRRGERLRDRARRAARTVTAVNPRRALPLCSWPACGSSRASRRPRADRQLRGDAGA